MRRAGGDIAAVRAPAERGGGAEARRSRPEREAKGATPTPPEAEHDAPAAAPQAPETPEEPEMPEKPRWRVSLADAVAVSLAAGLVIVFLGFLAVYVNDAPLTIIIGVVLAMMLIDLYQSFRGDGDGGSST